MHVPGHAGGFEDRRRAHDVEVDGLGGHAGDVVHVRHRGEVEDGIAAVEGADHLGQARDVDRLPLRRRCGAAAAVEDADRMSGLDQLVDDVAADEPGAACYCDLHARQTPAGIELAMTFDDVAGVVGRHAGADTAGRCGGRRRIRRRGSRRAVNCVEDRLSVERELVDLAAQADLEALAHLLLELRAVDALRQVGDELVEVALVELLGGRQRQDAEALCRRGRRPTRLRGGGR